MCDSPATITLTLPTFRQQWTVDGLQNFPNDNRSRRGDLRRKAKALS